MVPLMPSSAPSPLVQELRRRVPFLRWSFLRFILGMGRLARTWQVGDGREEALRRHVLGTARPGDLDGVIAAIDDFAYNQSFLINVGDEKGAILDAAVRRAAPRRVLELGAYCGYSALRMARAAKEARVFSVELSPDNAAIAQALWRHGGVADRVSAVVGTLGDGATPQRLREQHGFSPGSLDLLFLDHDKEAYVPDLQRVLEAGWLRPGAIVVADNVRIPGAPAYRALMKAEEGRRFRTREHRTHAEYQTLLPDLVLESEYLGP